MNTNEKIEKIEREQFRNKLNDNLDKINSTLTNLNRILSVNLIFNLQGTDFIKKNKKQIDEVIPSYIEVLNAINKNIKWKVIILAYQLYIIDGK